MHSWNDGADNDEVAGDEEECANGSAYDKAGSLGSSPMGARVTAQLQHDARYYGRHESAQSTRRTRLRDRMGLGALWADNDE